jgi:hypothetical protein
MDFKDERWVKGLANIGRLSEKTHGFSAPEQKASSGVTAK